MFTYTEYLVHRSLFRFRSCDYNKYTIRVLLDKSEKQKELQELSGVNADAENEDSDDDMLLIRSRDDELLKREFNDENEEDTDDIAEESDSS